MELKVGDKVRIKTKAELLADTANWRRCSSWGMSFDSVIGVDFHMNDEMVARGNTWMTIKYITTNIGGRTRYTLVEDNKEWAWSVGMFSTASYNGQLEFDF